MKQAARFSVPTGWTRIQPIQPKLFLNGLEIVRVFKLKYTKLV